MQSSSSLRKPWLFLGLIAVIALFGCGAASNAATTVSSATVAATSAPAKPAAHFKIGQTVSVGNTWQIVVNSATTSTGTDVFQPKSGDVYLLIDVSMKNISSTEQEASSLLQWQLRDSTGQQYNITINPNGTAMPDGKVEAGLPLRGVLPYEVPSAMHSYTLSFQADITASGAAIWDITV